MKTLRAVVMLPFALPGGELLKVPATTWKLRPMQTFDGEAFEDLPDSPSRAELAAALRQIWRPWAAYKFATDHDRAAMLAAIIGGVPPWARPRAGIVFDAPMPGSGKRLLPGRSAR